MISVDTAALLSILPIILSYLALKNQTLKAAGQIQEEIEKRIQPRYSINEPLNYKALPHTNWVSGELYFKVWHIEVSERRRGTWKKWLPRGQFRGRTIVQYEVSSAELPPQRILQRHHLARQPYVQSVKLQRGDPQRVKVIYNSVEPSSVSLFVSQFQILLRDSMVKHLNPDAEVKFEMIQDGEGGLYARVFDANVSEPWNPGSEKEF